jgi:hypothetical protein
VYAALVASFQSSPQLTVAAGLANVPARTLRRWIEKGGQGHADYVDLYQEYMAAKARILAECEGNVMGIARSGDTPQALAANRFIMQAYNRDEFSETRTHEHNVTVSAKQDEDEMAARMARLTDAELDALEAIDRKLLEDGDIVDAEFTDGE